MYIGRLFMRCKIMLPISEEFLKMCLDKIQSIIRLLKAVKAYECIEITGLIKLAEQVEEGVKKVLRGEI